ncbi:extracellular catalytic domain type 1 short-chain-length polyhydroxyalkanoate depolymerase [Nakamurella sp. GG22]
MSGSSPYSEAPQMLLPAAPNRWTRHRCRSRHGTRTYDVYLPASVTNARSAAPVLLLLHGCRQNSTDFAADSGFTAVADANGMVIIAPRQEMPHQLQRCWRWYESAHQHRGRGEPAILTDILAEVAASATGWRVDPRRVYVAGISAGGAMALILATTYPDVFAAAGVHSATAYRSATQGLGALGAMSARGSASAIDAVDPSAGTMAPVVVVHGTDDRIVRPPNADRIVVQWLASRRAGRAGPSRIRPLAVTRSLTVDGRRCLRTRWYTVGGKRVLEYWRVDGLAHAWSGGTGRAPFIDRSGPPAAELMWEFFSRHRRAADRPARRALLTIFAKTPALPTRPESSSVDRPWRR